MLLWPLARVPLHRLPSRLWCIEPNKPDIGLLVVDADSVTVNDANI